MTTLYRRLEILHDRLWNKANAISDSGPSSIELEQTLGYIDCMKDILRETTVSESTVKWLEKTFKTLEEQ